MHRVEVLFSQIIPSQLSLLQNLHIRHKLALNERAYQQYLGNILQAHCFVTKALQIIVIEAFLKIVLDFPDPGFQLLHESLSLGEVTDALHSLPEFKYLNLESSQLQNSTHSDVGYHEC